MRDRSKPEPDPEFELTDELATFFGDLHDSEINGEIGWFYDRVWRAKIGDPWNGFASTRQSSRKGRADVAL